ncbi:LYPLA2 [Lepeophtheirus salmonis]|uniref:palmitoyl-protein hydrolase n=1 Tax=Lepeophtheirus salmonis TaxID=72036 RepID=A0A7R8CIU0_LEPSM|nr:LYPLA2 [Lepeophtheirus salmonis]CAF2829711.1 LYPLA2 [Lepeophtheirus salmonis]
MTSIPPVVLKASVKHSATMIFLHGLGDTGFGWAGALNTIRPKYMKIVCPTANSIPVTCNGGMSMPAWYDILDINAIGGIREHLESLEASSANLDLLIEQEEYEDRTLGGAIALSAYLAGGDVPSLNGPKLTTPLLQVHGEIDEIVPYSRGVEASNILKELFSQFRLHSRLCSSNRDDIYIVCCVITVSTTQINYLPDAELFLITSEIEKFDGIG